MYTEIARAQIQEIGAKTFTPTITRIDALIRKKRAEIQTIEKTSFKDIIDPVEHDSQAIADLSMGQLQRQRRRALTAPLMADISALEDDRRQAHEEHDANVKSIGEACALGGRRCHETAIPSWKTQEYAELSARCDSAAVALAKADAELLRLSDIGEARRTEATNAAIRGHLGEMRAKEVDTAREASRAADSELAAMRLRHSELEEVVEVLSRRRSDLEADLRSRWRTALDQELRQAAVVLVAEIREAAIAYRRFRDLFHALDLTLDGRPGRPGLAFELDFSQPEASLRYFVENLQAGGWVQ